MGAFFPGDGRNARFMEAGQVTLNRHGLAQAVPATGAAGRGGSWELLQNV